MGRSRNNNTQSGMTLIELSVVLLILIALAGLATPYLSGTGRKALCDATDVTMANVKRAIMERYFLDTLGTFPATQGGSDFSLHYLFNAGGWSSFDPDTQVGWRGPYLMSSVQLESAAALPTNLGSAAGTYVHRGFTDNDNIILDGWGRPIIIQNSPNGFRLVSAGPGFGIGMNNADIETTIAGNRNNDDRVLYLNAPTPAGDINLSCD